MQKLTPMMQQYLLTKERHPDAILFFRLGDFYEMFFDDALVASRALDLTLTSRDKDADDPVPMCGIPHHAANNYIARLLERGHRVAICDQVEDPKLAKGIVRREVTRVVTPGTVLEDDVLDARQASFLMAVCPVTPAIGVSFVDVTTGEFRMAVLPGPAALVDEIARITPRELLLPRGTDPEWLAELRARFGRVSIQHVDERSFDPRATESAIEARFGGTAAYDAKHAPGLRAAGAVLAYIDSTQLGATPHITRLVPYEPSATMALDEATQTNLELTETLRGERQGSLLSVLDETETAMGARRLRQYLLYPLLDVAAIRTRQAAVAVLYEESLPRAELRSELRQIHDLERLTGRASTGVATPRDLYALRRSLERLPTIRSLIARLDAPLVADLAGCIADFSALAGEIARTLIDEPPASTKDGGYIRRGCSGELDLVLDLAQDGKGWLLRFEQQERKRTGIGSLKVRYNKVFGYYIEVTQANLERVPADYLRKQTLAGAERFITPELKDVETKVLGAEERRLSLERELFDALRRAVAVRAQELTTTASALADLDALAALAEVAERRRYCRPTIDDGDRLEIVEGRHPVVEATGLAEGFVPNDVTLDGDANQILLITGPNMAGKSTLLRQTALVSLLGQIGSFVPATRAVLGIVDRIFTRVGARDDLARGRSTFMVEMSETAQILHHATARSLVVLDEIGRGTSTFDGVSIAWAVAEYLHDRVRAKTLFATHYHELTELAETRERVRNFHVGVREWNDQVIFLRKLLVGGANRSYGIQVGRLAGLPKDVLERAKEVLQNLERGAHDPTGRPSLARRKDARDTGQMALFRGGADAPQTSAVVAELRAAELDALTPKAALDLVYRLRELAEREA
jgi:DNA mismatch repair protein MutS